MGVNPCSESNSCLLSVFTSCIHLPTASAGDITKDRVEDCLNGDGDLGHDKEVDRSDEQTEVTKTVHNITIHVTVHHNGTTITSL